MLKSRIEEHIRVCETLISDKYIKLEKEITKDMVSCLKAGKTIYFCGNGGSMADASHIAAELSGRFYLDREPLKALALANNPAFCTAVSNDFSFKSIFSRELEALGEKGDILIALSTSGKSENIIEAVKTAKHKNIKVIGFTGETQCEMGEICDLIFKIPSSNTPRIQEAYMLVLHTICESLESIFFSR